MCLVMSPTERDTGSERENRKGTSVKGKKRREGERATKRAAGNNTTICNAAAQADHIN